MGHTREEEYHTNRYRIVTDMPWSRTFIQKRLEDYHNISDRVEKLTQQIPENRKDTYFQLVKYPVQAATEMNKKDALCPVRPPRRNGLESKRGCL